MESASAPGRDSVTDSSATASSAAAQKPAPLTPDLCVIGAGRAGLALASAAAAFGVPTVLVARDGLGGAMRKTGSLASSALIAAGARAQALREAGRFGGGAGEPEVNFAQVHDHMARAVAQLAPNATAERLTALGVKVIAGEGRFRDRNSIQVGEHVIRARRFAIATGSRPRATGIPGLEDLAVLSEDTIATLTRRPERLIVLGGEPAAIALAQAMGRLGSAVTLIAPQGLLPGEDAEAVGLLRRALLREGVALHEEAAILRGETRTKGRLRLILDGTPERIVEGTHLLSTARDADIAALDLELGGLTRDDKGIVVNAGLRTGNRRVYAIGACAGGAAGGRQEPHAADHHASLVLRRALFRQPAQIGATIPRIVESEPALASAGLSEAEARAKAREIRVLRWPYAESDRAQAERRSEGFVKLVTDRKGRILGATIVGSQAGELITPWTIAIQKGLGVQEMAGFVFPSPSYSEISGRAALSHFAPMATKPGLRRLIGFLRRFG